jgi:hypothetical protein
LLLRQRKKIQILLRSNCLISEFVPHGTNSHPQQLFGLCKIAQKLPRPQIAAKGPKID